MKNSLNILLVEDNAGDIMLITDALEEAEILITIDVVNNGEKAINYLKKEGGFGSRNTPDLIILDINLPRLNGHEVLHFIKNNADTRHIPVVILTTSSSDKDIRASYDEYANCFITKPTDVDNFTNVIHRIENFWFNLVQLPNRNFTG